MGFRVETDVMVPMRDGVTLATDVWIPDGDEPRAALLVRLPYGKNSSPRWRSCRARPAWSRRGSRPLAGLPGHVPIEWRLPGRRRRPG